MQLAVGAVATTNPRHQPGRLSFHFSPFLQCSSRCVLVAFAEFLPLQRSRYRSPSMRSSLLAAALLSGAAVLVAQSPGDAYDASPGEFIGIIGGKSELHCLRCIIMVTWLTTSPTVAVLGNRVYYDGGILPQQNVPIRLVKRCTHYALSSNMLLWSLTCRYPMSSEHDPVHRPLPVLVTRKRHYRQDSRQQEQV